MKFCPKCGSHIKRLPNRKGQPKFCTRCGAILISEGTAEEAAPREPGLAGCFPYKSMRPFQKEVLNQVEAALAARKKFIILEAPVGFGKSPVAAALGLYLGSAYLLSSTKQLQDQYSRDFEFPMVTGKANFTCLVPTSSGKFPPCSRGKCEAGWKLSQCPHYLTFKDFDDHENGLCNRDSKCQQLKNGKLCPYYAQKWHAFRSPVMVANYAFFLSELNYTADVKRRMLLVCDEAHDLEKQMVGSASYTFRKSMLQSYQADEAEGEGSSSTLIPDMGIEEASAWERPLHEAEHTLEVFVDKYLGVDAMQDRVASCKDALESLSGFLEDLKAHPSNWVVNSVRKTVTVDGGGSVEEVVFQPLEVGAYTSMLFDTADTVLLMSATVFSQEVFCRTLGIPEEEACLIRVKQSSFPVENRRIHALDVAQLSRATMDSSMDKIAKAVDEIMTHHAGERGVVHTTSYQQANYIMEHVSGPNRARLSTTEGVLSRSELLRVHGETDESVLISPSLYQGVDLKDDLSRFQVLVKVPYPDLSERRTRVKLDRDRGWYDWQTALRLVQTYGRSVRSETDYAVTYVLDSNFEWFLRKHREFFPEYFLEALE
ncbi:MAG: helicase C-terminal domain-containing protein [Nitrososphaerales archaeon]|jgi:ATP-dependent DNA helicase DinG